MKCPNCVDTTLVMSDRQGVEIDYCPACRGVWLDRGELDKLLEKSAFIQSESAPQSRAAAVHVHQPAHVDAYYKDDLLTNAAAGNPGLKIFLIKNTLGLRHSFFKAQGALILMTQQHDSADAL